MKYANYIRRLGYMYTIKQILITNPKKIPFSNEDNI